MITIPAIETDGVLAPSVPIPCDAIAMVCDGKQYVVYEPGDIVPEIVIPSGDDEPAAPTE